MTFNHRQPFDATGVSGGTTRAFATLTFFVFGPAAVVAGRLVGAWRKFVWRVTWLNCLMRQFKMSNSQQNAPANTIV